MNSFTTSLQDVSFHPLLGENYFQWYVTLKHSTRIVLLIRLYLCVLGIECKEELVVGTRRCKSVHLKYLCPELMKDLD